MKILNTLTFTKSSDFDSYILDYLTKNNAEQAWVYFRYGYSKKEMLDEIFRLEACEVYLNGFEEIMWVNDWYEGQEFIELKAIITDKDVMDLIKWKEKELI